MKVFDLTKEKPKPLDLSKSAVFHVYGWPKYPEPANQNGVPHGRN